GFERAQSRIDQPHQREASRVRHADDNRRQVRDPHLHRLASHTSRSDRDGGGRYSRGGSVIPSVARNLAGGRDENRAHCPAHPTRPLAHARGDTMTVRKCAVVPSSNSSSTSLIASTSNGIVCVTA